MINKVESKKKLAIIVDIDDTILDVSDAVSIDDFGNLDLDYFYCNLGACKPIIPVISLVRDSLIGGAQIIFITGRDEHCGHETREQLDMLGFKDYLLYMRESGDLRSNVDVKRDYVKQVITKYNVILAFDDDEDNCRMYNKEFGIITLQVMK